MSYHEVDLASMPFGGFVVKGYISYLNELDPTHATAQSTSVSNASQITPLSSVSLPSCVLTEFAAAAALLELDPTHVHVR